MLATPATVTQKYLTCLKSGSLQPLCLPCSRHAQTPVSQTRLNLFSSDSVFSLIARQDGTFLIYSRKKDVDLSKICLEFKIIGTQEGSRHVCLWRSLPGSDVRQRSFIAGDHNGLGLEPSAIAVSMLPIRSTGNDERC